MAVNERIQRTPNDLPYGQLAPSQASRESWYPGKRPADVKAGDATWDRHYRVPTSIEEGGQGPIEVERVRVEKLGRNIISDQTIAGVQGVQSTITINDPATWGAGPGPQHVVTENATQDVNGEQERTAGYDWPVGLQS